MKSSRLRKHAECGEGRLFRHVHPSAEIGDRQRAAAGRPSGGAGNRGQRARAGKIRRSCSVAMKLAASMAAAWASDVDGRATWRRSAINLLRAGCCVMLKAKKWRGSSHRNKRRSRIDDHVRRGRSHQQKPPHGICRGRRRRWHFLKAWYRGLFRRLSQPPARRSGGGPKSVNKNIIKWRPAPMSPTGARAGSF